jgi:hypothetical protein
MPDDEPEEGGVPADGLAPAAPAALDGAAEPAGAAEAEGRGVEPSGQPAGEQAPVSAG